MSTVLLVRYSGSPSTATGPLCATNIINLITRRSIAMWRLISVVRHMVWIVEALISSRDCKDCFCNCNKPPSLPSSRPSRVLSGASISRPAKYNALITELEQQDTHHAGHWPPTRHSPHATVASIQVSRIPLVTLHAG